MLGDVLDGLTNVGVIVDMANALAGATGSRPRCEPIARNVPQWIGIAIGGWIRATASAARAGSRCPDGTRGPQPQIGSSATSTRPASEDI